MRKRKNIEGDEEQQEMEKMNGGFKRFRFSNENQKSNSFDQLPDDLVISILSKLSSTSSSPSDIISVLITCKRLNTLGLHPVVLSVANRKSFAVTVKNWSNSTHRFFKQCCDAGNLEALYTLGMIRFYCFKNRRSGASLMAKAAIENHAPALYSLAVIQFNGSGGTKNDKDLRAGVALCARAAILGYIDALRELGHCIQDGYGARKDVVSGRRLLIQANAREIASVIRAAVPSVSTGQFISKETHGFLKKISGGSGSVCPILSDFGCDIPVREVHPANRFLIEWFESKEYGLDYPIRVCSHVGCGRSETRRNEFRRCSACNNVNYCSRGCQAQDWKIRHKVECMPIEPWLFQNDEDDDQNGPEMEIPAPAPAPEPLAD
ncbi:F-box protein At5g50450 [Impatiens glandulifera]|uniref:F-box protein At5g50450 n=1 Tax=Impatiens glandulifera TaxID=253017 RepID=UPI001FB101E9|nr:F-box protein At5g50450 [Impatiens glandulifera]